MTSCNHLDPLSNTLNWLFEDSQVSRVHFIETKSKVPPGRDSPVNCQWLALSSTWQLAENQALRSGKQDWEGLERVKRKKHEKGDGEGLSSPTPSSSPSNSAERDSQGVVPCFPIPNKMTNSAHGAKGRKAQKEKREVTGKIGRQNKPTIRGSSILIHFILQKATQWKVKKLTKKKKRKKSCNMFFLPQQQAFPNELSLVQILQACITVR